MAEQTLDVRGQTLEIRRQRRRFSRSSRKTRSTRSSRSTRRTRKTRCPRRTRSSTACNGQARKKATSYRVHERAYAHTTGVLFFCCHKCHTIPITHYLTIIYTGNRNNTQKISHFHTATPPKKLPKTPFSTLLFNLKSQNNTSLFIKRHVVFYKTTRHFP